MSDLDVLRELAGELRPPPYDTLVGVARTRRRRLAVAASVSAAAAVVGVVLGVQSMTGHTETAPPVAPSPTPSLTERTEPANGQIQSWEAYVARLGVECGGCYPASFDQDTGRGLAGLVANHRTAALRVLGPGGLVASLDCPRVACWGASGMREMDLGPSPDEVSVLDVDEGSAVVQVLGFDGALRRTLDLSGVTPDFYDFQQLAWSPDGRQLALTTFDAKIWVVDRDGGDPRLVYDAGLPRDPSDADLEASIWGTTWSPDGGALGFVEGHLVQPASGTTPSLFRAVALRLPGAGQDGTGTARTLHELSAVPDSAGAGLSSFLWSPDGSRVAIRTPEQVLELSAEDGSVLDEHPFVDGLLVWPAGPS